jgi:hypothetical protein
VQVFEQAWRKVHAMSLGIQPAAAFPRMTATQIASVKSSLGPNLFSPVASAPHWAFHPLRDHLLEIASLF